MPMTTKRRWGITRELDVLYQELSEKHYACAPKNGELPIGGGDWMDTFFRMEGLRGTIGALQRGKNLSDAFEEGKTVSEISVRIWNGKREYQVHRWDKTVYSYLESVKKRVKKCQP